MEANAGDTMAPMPTRNDAPALLAYRLAFASRLNRALEIAGYPSVGRVNRLSEFLGVNKSAAAKWLKAEALPQADKLPLIAKTLGVSLLWLAYGIGPTSTETTIDRDLAAQLQEIIDEFGSQFSARQRAHAFVWLYDHCLITGDPIDTKTIAPMVPLLCRQISE